MTILRSDPSPPSTYCESIAGRSRYWGSNTEAGPRIIDIRRGNGELCRRDDITEALNLDAKGERTLPTLLLYDEDGLKLFEKITYLEEYYPTNAEIEVLESNCHRIAERIQNGSRVVELGSGNLRKVRLLLDALDKAAKKVEYFALDVSLPELQRTLADIDVDAYKYVKCYGLHGSYDDGLRWLLDAETKPTALLSLGSSIGNFSRPEAAAFLARFAANLRNEDIFILGIDSCKDPVKVYHAYNDKQGLTHEFILNGLSQANRIFGYNYFDLQDWKVIGRFNVEKGCHQAFLTPVRDVSIYGSYITKGEEIRIEESYKYSADEIAKLWEDSGLAIGPSWFNKTYDYGIHMVSKAHFHFPRELKKYSEHVLPTLSDWENTWSAWDQVTRRMIPEEQLMSSPIDLRNPCIFYLGHIPTFLDIHLSRASNSAYTEPNYYTVIFERGIDPDVDDPTQCHVHSEIPQEWPTLKEITDYQRRVRDRVKALYSDNVAGNKEAITKAICIGFEHELMHLETLLYMLIQSEKMRSPSGHVRPDFESAAKSADHKSIENEWFEVPETVLVVGRDCYQPSEKCKLFGWDIEFPRRNVRTKKFLAKGRPITVRDYISFLTETGGSQLPASWCQARAAVNGATESSSANVAERTNGVTNGIASGASTLDHYVQNKAVKTVWGNIPLLYALHWPVMASYDELSACARWMGGRIPTQEEVYSIYALVENRKIENPQKALGRMIPAVNAHLVNDGVEESPPSSAPLNGSSSRTAGQCPNALFADLKDANVGFRHWHPTPITDKGNKLCGQGELGGVWEWTSSVLEQHQGFEAMQEYPGYTADFFDGKHNIVLGGSWATHPRIAGRKSFVNWYQRSYPYAWAGARLVRDI